MLKRLHLRNFTVFEDADFEFLDKGLNVIVGANGTGKSHVLKAGYTVSAASALMSTLREQNLEGTVLNFRWDFILAHYFTDVFRVENKLKSLIHRGAKENQSSVKSVFGEGPYEKVAFEFLSADPTDYEGINLTSVIPLEFKVAAPVFLPAKEVLSLFPGFGSLYKRYELPVDRAFADLTDQLGLPLLRNPEGYVSRILAILERIMRGKIKSDNGRFYLYPEHGDRFEIDLVAEGVRKLAALAYLLANGTLTPETTLFWDEPEANLNPALLKEMAAVLTELAKAGFQIILATHSLFLLKELHILAQREKQPVRYFALYAGENGATQVETKDDFIQLEHIAALDAELTQTFDFEAALDDEYAGDS